MKRARTKAEYQAQAMLMGMGYAVVVHVFFKSGELGLMLDADTLEPIDRHKTGERYERQKYDTFADGQPVARVTTGGNSEANDQ